MGNLTGEIGGAQRLLAERAHGLTDGVAGKTAEPAEHLPLLGHRKAFKAGLAMAGAALDVLLQALQQAVLAGTAQQEVGAAAQVFLKLPARRICGRQQRTETRRHMPQAGPQQQGEQQQSQWEVAQ